jgi:hypothetical protein
VIPIVFRREAYRRQRLRSLSGCEDWALFVAFRDRRMQLTAMPVAINSTNMLTKSSPVDLRAVALTKR